MRDLRCSHYGRSPAAKKCAIADAYIGQSEVFEAFEIRKSPALR